MQKNGLVLLICLILTGCGGTSNISNTHGNNQAVSQSSSPSAKDLTSQTVNIGSSDGVVLVGTFLEADKPRSPAVLLLHQWQSDRHSYDNFAWQMEAKGFNVLSIDGRGFGETVKKPDGTAISAGRTDADVKAMLADVGAAFD